MARLSLDEIKNQKNFYRNHYYGVMTTLLVSLVVNLGLTAAIIYNYLTQLPPKFYATSGVKAPIALSYLEQPNTSTTYLLPPDPPEE